MLTKRFLNNLHQVRSKSWLENQIMQEEEKTSLGAKKPKKTQQHGHHHVSQNRLRSLISEGG